MENKEVKKEDKARFFAQYIGQDVFFNEEVCSDGAGCVTIVSPNYCANQPGYLELFSLSSISDEDAIEVAKMCQSPLENQLLAIGKDIVYAIDKKHDRIYVGGFRMSMMIDYLRSKGYALPFMQYSVETLVNLGWIKLAS